MGPSLESRVRDYLAGYPKRITPYTATRVAASFSFVRAALSRCGESPRGHAIDVGCGAGFDSFALAAAFDDVLAIDAQRGPVVEAARIASGARVENVHFVRGDALEVEETSADLIWCNVMSHNTSSRTRLLATLARALRPGGWLVYAEECEGYVGKSLCTAVAARDAAETRARIRQGLAGVLGRPVFRFFLSGTAGPLLSDLGCVVRARMQEQWGPLTVLERVWAQRQDTAVQPQRTADPDYLVLPEDLATVRATFASLCADGAIRGLQGSVRMKIDEVGHLAAFGLILPMATVALPRARLESNVLECLSHRLPRSVAQPKIDWAKMDELTRSFTQLTGSNVTS